METTDVPTIHESMLKLWDHSRAARDNAQDQLRQAEKIVVALRGRLREDDATLPDIYDGTAWAEHEQEWITRYHY